MKINDLSKITHINTETIRMYRQKGLLHPQKLENGYYDYSIADLVSLTHLRKMREYSMSLDNIQMQQRLHNNQDIIEIFNKRSEYMDKQIQEMKKRIQILELEKSHLKNAFHTNMDAVSIIQSTDRKIDFYGEHLKNYIPFRQNEIDAYLTSTVSIHISKDILNGEIKDAWIPLEVGVGTYEFMIAENQTVPDYAVVIPNGRCICQTLQITDLTKINILSLAPMMQYAKDIQKPFVSDTTAYLAYIHTQNDVPTYTFRIRACIEENDIVSSDTRIV